MFTYLVRAATASDQDAVNSLSKGIYHGTDFTAKVFKDWVNDRLWLPFVAEVNSGQVVGFLALNVTDDGESVVVRSSRVAEEYRGNGIYKQMLDWALRFASKRLTSTNCIIRARPAHIRMPPGYKAIKLSSKIVLSCTPKSLEDVPLPPIRTMSPFQEHCLTVKEFSMIYEGEEAFRKLFVGDILTIEGETFHMNIPANWEFLEKRNNIFVIYTRYPDDSMNKGGVLSVLCVSCKETNDGKPYITLNIFGKEAAMVGYHILKAMKTATLFIGCDFNLGLFVDIELEELISEFVKEELDFCKIIWQRRLQIQEADLASHFLS